jgi:tetratricopeptide (TPR) repeat protein
VRFGAYRSSYYATCSGYGYHSDPGHHCHLYDCSSHGQHSYHVRDCAECYPSGTHVDVEVPVDAAAQAAPVESVPLAPEGQAAASNLVAEAAILDPQERFFASLRPAQLSFVFGLGHLKAGKYDEATEALYNASIEDPESKLVKVFLGISLFSAGEYGYAAEYLRLGLEEWEAFPGYQWRVQDLYGRPGDFDSHLALLEEETRLNPAHTDAALVLGFLAMHSGDLAKAGNAFDSVRSLSSDGVEQTIARRYIAEIEVRTGAFPGPAGETAPPAEEDATIQAFLASLAPADVPKLPIR